MFGFLSTFSMILLEVYSALYLYEVTHSLRIVYSAMAAQFAFEWALTYSIPSLLKRYGVGILLLLSVPFRIAALLLLMESSNGIFYIFISMALVSISSTASEIPRGVLFGAAVRRDARGLNIGLLEVFRYIAVALAPLVGGYTLEYGGFASLALLSIIVTFFTAASGFCVHAALGDSDYLNNYQERGDIRIPNTLRVLWWSTGIRYLGENCLYPILTFISYASAVKMGWVAFAAVFSGVIFGLLVDRFDGRRLLFPALAVLLVGWYFRSIEISFSEAILVATLCAIGGKAAGVVEKKTSFDFGDKYRNNSNYMAKRERAMLLSRAIVLLPCVAFDISPLSSINFIVVAVAVNMCYFVIKRNSLRDIIH